MKIIRRISFAILLPFMFVGLQAADASDVSAEAEADQFYMTTGARMEQPRVPPLADADLDEESAQLLESVRIDGKLYNLFGTLANHPELMAGWLPFGKQVLFLSTIPAREREIIILRMSWLNQAEYAFAHHVAIGKQAGVTDADIRRVTQGPDTAGLDSFDAALIRAVDELNQVAFISNSTWETLAKNYNTQQMMDLVALAGQYKLAAMMLNSFGVPLEEEYKNYLKRPRPEM